MDPLDQILRQQEKGDLAGARRALDHYRRLHPESVRALAMAGHFALEAGELETAEESFRAALRRQERSPHLHCSLAKCLQLQGRLGDAIRAYAEGLRLAPDNQQALQALVTLLDQSGVQEPLADAAIEVMLAHYEKQVRAHPGKVEHLAQLAHRLDLCRRYDEAQKLYEQALERWPDSYKLHNNLGLLHARLGRSEQALVNLQRAVELAPEVPELHLNVGETLNRLNRADDAIRSFERALELKPDFAEAGLNLSALYRDLNDYSQALHYAEVVRQFHPERAGVYNMLGIIQTALGNSEAAVEAYYACLKRSPGSSLYHSNYLLSLNYDQRQTTQTLYEAHREFSQRFEPAMDEPIFPQRILPNPGKVLRIGLISADLRMHSVAFFLEPLLGQFDREQVEIHCLSNVGRADHMTALLRSHAHHWHEVYGRPPEEVAALIRRLELDVLVDLSGHTGYHALPVFMRRPAPLRVSWLGYPNTTGLNAMQYRLVDAVVEPEGEADKFSSERVVRLPEGFHCFRLPQEAPEVSPLPAETNGFLTFGSFNNSSKITPQVTEAWARVLLAVPNSRLVLKNSGYMHPNRKEEVLQHFEALGVARERVEMLPRTPDIAAHLQLYSRVDVALDTFPYNGTTTTLEALHQGVPTLSLLGDRHAARVSASLLQQVDLGEFVAESVDDFVARAVWLSQNVPVLSQLRASLRARFKESALGDYSAFARKLENAFRRMWIDWCRHAGAEDDTLAVAEAVLAEREQQVQARALARRGMFAQRRGRIEEARQSFNQTLEIDATLGYAWQALAELAYEAGDYAAARPYYERAVELMPRQALLRANLGSCCQQLGDYACAITHFRLAVQIEPNRPGVWMNLGATWQAALDWTEAEAATRKALELLPDFPAAWTNLGSILKDQGRFEEAIEAYFKTLQLQPDDAVAHSNLLVCLQYVEGMSEDDLAAQHDAWVGRHAPLQRVQLPARRVEKLRVAYLSPDFRQHPVSAFMEGVFAHHDREQVEVWMLHDSHRRDACTERLAKRADHAEKVAGRPDAELAKVIRQARIDVLVELSGHMALNRLPLLAQRVAPLQLSYLGYPFPTHLPNLDGWLTDSTIAGTRDWQPQALLIPGGAHAFTAPANAPAVEPLPAKQRGYITFGCANQAAKLSTSTLQLWGRLLRELPNARLILKAKQFSDPALAGVFVERLAKLGLPLGRIELRGYRIEQATHLAFYHEIDIALDPYPYNGVTTTCEALWMGVPVVTLRGDRPAARHAASLLEQLGHPEWIASDADGYLATAANLARDVGALAAQRFNLRQECQQSSLGDSKRLARELERLYRERLPRYHAPSAGTAPAHDQL
ncbi:MAG: tetratricopeptide repeat protein [Verrucomicrobiota bacterium JB022]|nr:tetratricopeptide repeat protein [Verrucomicrobiota bacterium JB022]